jgi:uncharacterized protein
VPDFFDTETAELYHAPLMAASSKNDITQGGVIDNVEFARKALEIHDTIAVSQFSRLHDALASSEGVLDCRIAGSVDESGRSRLQLHVHGSLQLSCQRCLGPFEFELDIASSFLIVPDESAMPPPEDESDDEDYLVAQARMPLIDFIEDEVLLALPLAPKHTISQCSASSKLDELKKSSPFAVLQALKTRN